MKTTRTTRNTMIAALAVAGCTLPAMADFSYPSFTNTAGLNLVGTAVHDSTRILLTQSTVGNAGAVWVQEKQDVSLGFDATMAIKVENRNGGGADGFALVIQNSSATALGGTGGAMGFARNPVFGQPGIANSIAIALDMWDNNIRDWEEPGDNHLTVQTRGTEENSILLPFSLGNQAIPDASEGGLQHTVRVFYTPGLMSIYLDGAVAPALQVQVDLSTLLNLDNGKAWIGVTSATGAGQDAQTHVLNSLCFMTVPTPGTAGLFACGGLLMYRRRRN